MTAHLTLKPVQNRLNGLVDQYGDRLLYIRYRYDAEKRKRCKTVEIIVEEAPWEPANGIDLSPLYEQTEMPVQIEIQLQPDKLSAPNILSNQNTGQEPQNLPMDAVVGVKVDYAEKDLQEKVREEGGVWDRPNKLWLLTNEKVLKLGLSNRVVRRLDQTEK